MATQAQKDQAILKAEADAFTKKKADAEAAEIAERARLQAIADDKAILDADADAKKVLADKLSTEIAKEGASEAVLEAERVALAHLKDLEDAIVTAAKQDALPKHGPDVEGQGTKARYVVTLGYPLHHPYQNKLVGQDVENAVTLKMDFWVRTQLDARLIQVAPEVE